MSVGVMKDYKVKLRNLRASRASSIGPSPFYFSKKLMAVALADFQPKADNAETPTKDETEQDSACEYKTVRRYYDLG